MEQRVGENFFSAAVPAYRQHPGVCDVIEVFAGVADLSLRAIRFGSTAGEPIDLVYNWDQRSAEDRAHARAYISEARPHLVVIGFPCAKSCGLFDVSPADRQQELEELRRLEEPFLHVSADTYADQVDRGDDDIVEQPGRSRALGHVDILMNLYDRYSNHLFQVTGSMCQYGKRAQLCRKPRAKGLRAHRLDLDLRQLLGDGMLGGPPP